MVVFTGVTRPEIVFGLSIKDTSTEELKMFCPYIFTVGERIEDGITYPPRVGIVYYDGEVMLGYDLFEDDDLLIKTGSKYLVMKSEKFNELYENYGHFKPEKFN